ncbi:pseudouridylate synthase, putative [Plasmodium reichenowi]|uniref:Pseudouridylate synthase, putative n=1 Tax=Plasmodium reichenowi TaxID=5854 RepID=A0A060RXK0_PLARE|nr:pseudouridylate synthase, putative [Plasmodium reichenowi]
MIIFFFHVLVKKKKKCVIFYNIMFFFLIIFILLTSLNKGFKIMKIVIPQTSGLNIVDKKFEPKYFVKNKLRFVSPYVYTYKLFSKKRWVGKKIADVMASEFCAYDMNYFIESIKKGYVKVNKQMVSSDYIIQSNDFIEHKLLLFEKPVLCNKIIILYEDENFICVYKHSSLPTHPVGSYQYNSLLRILQNYISTSQKIKQDQDDEVIAQNEKENYKQNVSQDVNRDINRDINQDINQSTNTNTNTNTNTKRVNVEEQSEHVIKINFNFKKENFGFMLDDMKENSSCDDKKIKIKNDHISNCTSNNDNYNDKNFTYHDHREQTYYHKNVTQNINDLYRKDEILNISQEKKKRRKIKQANIISNEQINNMEIEKKKQNENILDTLNVLINCREKSMNQINHDKEYNADHINKCKQIYVQNVKNVPKHNSHNVPEHNSHNVPEHNSHNVPKHNSYNVPEHNSHNVPKHNSHNNNFDNDLKTQDKSYIYTLHRLDKLTSGIVFFGKNKKFSTYFSQNLSDNKIKKTYITRVQGDFRKLITKLLHSNNIIKSANSQNNNLDNIINNYCNNSMKNNDSLKFNKYDEDNLFENDIFLYENNYEKNNHDKETCGHMKEKNIDDPKNMFHKLIELVKNKKEELNNYFDMNKFDITYDINNDKYGDNYNNEDINNLHMYHKYFIIDFGYMYCENKKLLKYVFTKYTKENALQFSDYLLKPSITKFMFLSYNSSIDESLILCQPITGRTHQIRAHLESLSYPISNDSHYNKIFEQEYIHKSNYIYFEESTRSEHIQIKEQINNILQNKNTHHAKKENKTCNNDKELFEHEPNKNHSYNQKKTCEKYNYFPLIPFINTSFNWLYDQNINLNQDYNEKDLNNYFFKNINNVSYHSSGIFLHSFRYTWKNIFDVFTLLPKWSQPFYLPQTLIAFLLYGDLA